MLCTFKTETDKTLVVRSDDIRSIADDTKDISILTYLVGDDRFVCRIQGTATENLNRIQQDELDMIGRIEEHRQQLQRRMAEGYPAIPVLRGKQR